MAAGGPRAGQVRITIDRTALRAYVRAMPEVRDGVQRVGEGIAGDARRHIRSRTGKLANSIIVRRSMRAGQESSTVRVEARIYYAKFVEFGTRHMRPRPFMRPAANKYRSSPSPGG